MHRRRATLALSSLALLTACGGDSSADRAPPCGGSLDGDPVEITLRMPEAGFGTEGLRDLVEQFNESQDDVVATIDFVAEHPALFAVDLLEPGGGEPVPDLVEAEPGTLRALIDGGVVVPLDDCLAATGDDLDGLLTEAVDPYRVDGSLWALPRNVDAGFLLYDRAAFVEAGLDPDEPPATLAELHATATALAALGRFEAPVVLDTPLAFLRAAGVPLSTDGAPAFDTPDAVEITRELAAMHAEGLLLDPATAEGPLPPIGAGRAAIEVAGAGDLWGYASALASGQAPAADLGVAAIPGLIGPAVPIGGPAYVLPSASTGERRAAAWRLLSWLEQPAQQAQLHVHTDSFPTDPAAGDEPAAVGYWEELPLLRAASSLVLALPTTDVEDPFVIGMPQAINYSLGQIIYGGADPATELDVAAERTAALLAAYDADPVAWITCVIDAPPVECLTEP